MKTDRFKSILLAAILLGLLASLAACSTTPKPLKFTLVADDIMWSTHEIHAKVNQEVELTIRNDGILDHDFVIEELNIDMLISPGESKTVTFTIDHAGSIKYICNIPGHEEAGMVGEIIITD